MNKDLTTKIERLCTELTEMFDSEFPTLAGSRTHTFKKGRKFVKIIEADAEGNSRSVWGFINLAHDKFEVGDILLAAGWAAPALNKARGNLLNGYLVSRRNLYGPGYIAGYCAGGKRVEGGLI